VRAWLGKRPPAFADLPPGPGPSLADAQPHRTHTLEDTP